VCDLEPAKKGLRKAAEASRELGGLNRQDTTGRKLAAAMGASLFQITRRVKI
jgi:hypothetical protein